MSDSTEKKNNAGFGHFLKIILPHWFSLMGGTLGVILWAIAALAEPWPVPLRLSFVIAGTIAAIVACFMVWKKEHDKGKEALDLLAQKHRELEDIRKKPASAAVLQAKHEENLKKLRTFLDHLKNHKKWGSSCFCVGKNILNNT